MICKVCKKDVPYDTFSEICSSECQKKENERLALVFEGQLYSYILEKTNEIHLHDFKLVKSAADKVLSELSFTW